MSDKPLPEKLRRRYQVDTVDEMWRKHLIEGNVRTKQWRHLFGMLPANPRCVNCHTPFAGFGSVLLRLIRGPLTRRSVKNPRYCAGCHFFTTQFPGGAEIELTMLFVDVRGSTTIAEAMNSTEFSQLMNRFYDIPGYAGKDHARKAVEAGQELLRVTGYSEAGGPWIPIGVGVHTGTAWVGSIVRRKRRGLGFHRVGRQCEHRRTACFQGWHWRSISKRIRL